MRPARHRLLVSWLLPCFGRRAAAGVQRFEPPSSDGLSVRRSDERLRSILRSAAVDAPFRLAMPSEAKWTKAAARPQSPPDECSSRARSRSDRWHKQRGKTPSLAATRGHTTALGHLGCHKDKVIEPCFGRRARRAAHVSDPRRWKEVKPKGVTAAARRCRASLLTRARRAAEAALPDARSDPFGELGQNPRGSGRLGRLGRPRFEFFFFPFWVRMRPQASTTECNARRGAFRLRKEVAQNHV